MKKISTLILFLIMCTAVFAQNIEFTKENFKDNKDGLRDAKKNIEKGDAYFIKGTIFYNWALEPYLAACKFNPSNALLNFKIGKSYLYSNYKLKSVPHLEKALSLNPFVDPEIHLLLGKAYHLDMQFDKAIEELKLFQKSLTKKADLAVYSGRINKQIEECIIGKEMVKKPIRVFIDNVGPEINSQYTDYGPVISADESMMLFTSRRP